MQGGVALVSLVIVLIAAALEFLIESGSYEVTQQYPGGAYYRMNKYHLQLEPSPFQSIPSSIYWACITFATEGYGWCGGGERDRKIEGGREAGMKGRGKFGRGHALGRV